MKVFILTNFSGFLKSYSPIIVTGLQIQMLKAGGYEPVLIVSEGWNPPEDSIFSTVETHRLPSVPVSNEPGVDATFEEDVKKIHAALNQILPEDAVVITHDLIFLPDYTKHNVAARALAEEEPGIRWLHWIHSATAPRGLIEERMMWGDTYKDLLSQKFPNSVAVFPNAYSIPRVARNFGFERDEVFEVPHPSDLTEGMEHVVRRLYNHCKLYEPTVLMVYPLRLDRGKNAEMNIRLIGGLKRMGTSAKLILCDFQSTGGDKVVYRDDLKELASAQGVLDDVIFVSEFDPSTEMEISHKAVLDLFTLSNVFLMPSKSETYSLVTQEAMVRGNFCIINHDFAPFRQIFGDNAVYMQFSGNIGFDGYDGEVKTEYGNINAFFDDMARLVNYYLLKEKTLKAKTWVRTERNLHSVFKKYLEPLLGGHRAEV
jgi:glycosyltransferase involved in cell wall biosynthesis